MIDINVLLPLLLYIAGFVLLIVLIIVGIKLIGVLTKLDGILDNIDGKVSSLDGAFNMIDKFSDGVALVGDRIVTNTVSAVNKIFNKKREEYDDYE